MTAREVVSSPAIRQPATCAVHIVRAAGNSLLGIGSTMHRAEYIRIFSRLGSRIPAKDSISMIVPRM